ncbi:MAG: hypothetical protein ACUVRD_06710 [Bacteroidia bacterium]
MIVADAYPAPYTLETYWQKTSFLQETLIRRGFKVQHTTSSVWTACATPALYAMENTFCHATPPKLFESTRILDSLGYLLRVFVPTAFSARCVVGEKTYRSYLSNLDDLVFRYLYGHLGTYLSVRSYLQTVNQNLLRDTTGPSFTYIHIFLPHLPYVIDSTGHFFHGTPTIQAFYRQLGYTDKVLLAWVYTILAHEKNPIIILRSDHGPVRGFLAQAFAPKTLAAALAKALGSYVVLFIFLRILGRSLGSLCRMAMFFVGFCGTSPGIRRDGGT